MDKIYSEQEDAYGREILAHYLGEYSFEVVERDDGYFYCSGGPYSYFLEYEEWPEHQKQAMQYVQGRVLDVGCGAGRVGLHLKAQGFQVVGIDNSPLALEVCRLRGFRNVSLTPLEQVDARLGTFDTIIMFGNNFGLFGDLERAREILHRLYKVTTPQARILAESNDITQSDDPDHIAYQIWNQERGRMPGQLRMRVRFQKYATPWFDYLVATKDEMSEVVAGTGWQIAHFLDEPDNNMYIGVLEKEKTAS